MKKTPLYEHHVNSHARMIEFAGFLMPVFYTSIKEEHLNVRGACGIFDISHMGIVFIRGEKSLAFLQKLLTGNLDRLYDGRIIYSLLSNEKGGVIDDVLVYRKAIDQYFLVINASNVEKDLGWLKQWVTSYSGVSIDFLNDKYGMIAVQGPKSPDVMCECGFDVSNLAYYHFMEIVYANSPLFISKTGYTGEKGFEIFGAFNSIVGLWEKFLSFKESYSIKPIGLGARDTLRLECGFPLYGHELNEDISPAEAGLKWVVDLSKDFVGKEEMIKNFPKRKLVGFKMLDKGIPRADYEVFLNNKCIGKVTSGSYLPSLNQNMGLALIQKEAAVIGQKVKICIREKFFDAQIIETPFVLPFNKRKENS